MAPAATTLLYTSTVFPAGKSSSSDMKLSVFDLPMLSTHYIQKGCLYDTRPPFPHFVSLLQSSLSKTLTHFPPLAGRLVTDPNGHVYVTCNDAGVHFVHAVAAGVSVGDVLGSPGDDVPEVVKEFFAFDLTLSYRGHFMPLLAVQVTELADGVFVGCSVNHAVIDGTSLWNFFNTFAEVARGVERITRKPELSRDSVFVSPAVLKLPDGGPKVAYDVDAPVRERIFSFTRESILRLKAAANNVKSEVNGDVDPANEISSFQSLCALLWRAVTRARKFPPSKTTTFLMAVNCRHRVEPKLDPLYFGNAIQGIHAHAVAGDVLSRDLRWCAGKLNEIVRAHGDATVRRIVEDWERDPHCFQMGNFDGATITMGSSPRLPMYDNGFGWGKPVAVRSGRANKFDGNISAFPGREGGGSVDLEVALAPEIMAGIESDPEFMHYVSCH